MRHMLQASPSTSPVLVMTYTSYHYGKQMV
jgi:hypothetical protein